MALGEELILNYKRQIQNSQNADRMAAMQRDRDAAYRQTQLDVQAAAEKRAKADQLARRAAELAAMGIARIEAESDEAYVARGESEMAGTMKKHSENMANSAKAAKVAFEDAQKDYDEFRVEFAEQTAQAADVQAKAHAAMVTPDWTAEDTQKLEKGLSNTIKPAKLAAFEQNYAERRSRIITEMMANPPKDVTMKLTALDNRVKFAERTLTSREAALYQNPIALDKYMATIGEADDRFMSLFGSKSAKPAAAGGQGGSQGGDELGGVAPDDGRIPPMAPANEVRGPRTFLGGVIGGPSEPLPEPSWLRPLPTSGMVPTRPPEIGPIRTMTPEMANAGTMPIPQGVAPELWGRQNFSPVAIDSGSSQIPPNITPELWAQPAPSTPAMRPIPAGVTPQMWRGQLDPQGIAQLMLAAPQLFRWPR